MFSKNLNCRHIKPRLVWERVNCSSQISSSTLFILRFHFFLLYQNAPFNCTCEVAKCWNSFNPLPDNKILPLSKLKAFADNNFDVAQIAKVFSCRVENIMEKGENAGFQHFLLFPVFSQGFFLRVVKTPWLFGTGLKYEKVLWGKWEHTVFLSTFKVPHCCLTLYHTIPTFNNPEKEGLENRGKMRKCWLPAFSPFPTIISTLAKTNFNFSVTFSLSTPNAFNLDKP